MRKFNLVLIFVSIITIDAFSIEKVKEKFKIYGNCGMYNEVITKAAKSVDGVIYLKWNSKTKIAKIKYDADKTSLDEVQKKIASVGYDKEKYKAVDEVYNNLHYCCKYDREN